MEEIEEQKHEQVRGAIGEEFGSDTAVQIYEIPAPKQEQLENQFSHHAPKGDQPGRYILQRRDFLKMAMLICNRTPAGRERSIALTKLEEAMFWANAAIARNE